MVEQLQALPEGLNQPEQFLADAGYFSEAREALKNSVAWEGADR